jgi:hypothetical protein
MFYRLRHYQRDILYAVLDSVSRHSGLTFSVEISRQGGKNELSAQLEYVLLSRNAGKPVDLVKCSPTFIPQAVISMTRLKDRLDNGGCTGDWSTEHGYIVRLGDARAIFLSADESSRVVGHTAHLLLEIDEAQDVAKEKYSKEFKPMGATTNVTTVLYGTAWDDSTLLEETKQHNLELERKDGIRRHFQYDWQEVAKYNPDYRAYVESEKQRLGENHPLFLTQYCLQPIRGGGGFLSPLQRAQLQGDHPRSHSPQPQKVYIAGIDLAGEAEELEGEYLTSSLPRLDSTVVTIAELGFSENGDLFSPFPKGREGEGFVPSPFLKVGQRGILSQNPHPRPDRESRGSSSVNTLDSRLHGNEVLSSNDDEIPFSSPLSPPWERARVRASIRILEHYQWTGKRHTELYPQLVDLLKNVWRCRRVVVDATGIGQPVASFLKQTLGRSVLPFTFTAPAKSQLGFNLLAAINSGSLKMYAPDGSPEYQEFWYQMEKAKSYYRPSQTMNFFIDSAQGHDDFLMSLALLVEASRHSEPRVAKGKYERL